MSEEEGGMNFNCPSTVIEECEGLTVEMTDEGWYDFVFEAVETLTVAIKIGVRMFASEMTPNMMLGVNALRCATMNGFINVWYFIAAAYYAAKQFGQEALVEEYINQAYPYVCTCYYEANQFANQFGGERQEGEQDYFSSCSEATFTTVE